MVFEYSNTPVPRIAMLVPDDLAKSELNPKDYFGRFASDAGIVKRYNLFFVCDGCTLFPSTQCSCENVLNDPVQVEMSGATLRKLAPALKAAATLYTIASAPSNVTGVQLPLKLPGIRDVAEFAEAVNEFVEGADNMGAVPPSAVAGEDHGQDSYALASFRAQAYGSAYAALAELLARSGEAPSDNTCQGLVKVADQADGNVYWVCNAHAETHAERFLSASTIDQEVGICPPAVPKEEEDVKTTLPTKSTDSVESAEPQITIQETKVSKLWTEGKFVDTAREASNLVKVLEDFARASDQKARFAAKAAILAKEAAARGFQGKLQADLNDPWSTNECQGGCGDKFGSVLTPFLGKQKRNCMACGHVVCAECLSPPKLHVEGYSEFQHVCKKCVGELNLKLQHLEAAAEEAAVQSAAAREYAQVMKDDNMGTAPLSGAGAVTFLQRALHMSLAEEDLERALFLKRKLKTIRELGDRRIELKDDLARAYEAKNLSRCLELEAALKSPPVVTLFMAIALDAFPVNTVVRASVADGGVVDGTAGEVIGHSSSGHVVVQFKDEGIVEFEIAALQAAELPSGWAVKQSCFSAVEIPGELSIGQPGSVLGWSKPFDCDKIMVDFGDCHMNVQLNQIETADQFRMVRANSITV